MGDFLNVCAEMFTKVSEHVGIGNLDSQEGIGGLLDEFGAAHACEKKLWRPARWATARMDGTLESLLKDGIVDLPESRFRFGVVHSQEYALRVEEILDGSAFAQKLRVGGNSEASVGIGRVNAKKVF